ncbi:recombinase family protein [Phytohabitans sp. ZYX-F-186]|uniref:Recombinase family protein n=1 Tax=Phytohabitans maris TaxID=3071409 RepID=A0ABU0ZSL0_9ACTN|nr:recombinase family protein [Phytohabitans sp. ZYX-F-186]MDQ7909987.1 recombinase family protein [Phytohabitans sp. ZYX-F-186]
MAARFVPLGLQRAGAAGRRPCAPSTEPLDTATLVGRMLVHMLGVFAEFERGVIVDRVVSGMEKKASRGQWACR